MALYMNGQEVSKSSGVPIKVEGLTEINEGTPSNIQGLVKGNGSTLQAAEPGIDYPILPKEKSQNWYRGDSIFLEDNKIYNLTYVYDLNEFQINGGIYAPNTWAHGTFYTNCYLLNAGIVLDGMETAFNPPQFIGGAPTIKSKTYYEFDVFNNVWAIQEIVGN